MAFTKLTAEQLSAPAPAPAPPLSEYAQFLIGLAVGEGGRGTVETEGVSRQSIKARLKAAAKDVGAEITFHRSGNDEVIFEVTSAATLTPTGRRRGQRKTSAPEA